MTTPILPPDNAPRRGRQPRENRTLDRTRFLNRIALAATRGGLRIARHRRASAAAAATTVLIVLTALISTTYAYASVLDTKEAEMMTLSGGTTLAAGGESVRMDTNGDKAIWVNGGSAGGDTVVATAMINSDATSRVCLTLLQNGVDQGDQCWPVGTTTFTDRSWTGLNLASSDDLTFRAREVRRNDDVLFFDKARVEGTVPATDTDGDGIQNNQDNCPNDPGPASNNGCPVKDTDGDGVPDASDNCVDVPNANQADTDNDGTGDACDSQDNRDSDGDGVQNYQDNCPNQAGPASNGGCPAMDTDGDGVPDASDNCPYAANPDQADQDADGKGDVCDDDIDGDGRPNASDFDPYDPNVQDAPQTQRDCTGLQNRIDNAAAGSTLDLPDGCLYRASATVGKQLTIVGGPNRAITGTEKYGGTYDAIGNDFQTSQGGLPNTDNGTGDCEPGAQGRCANNEQAFLDGVRQTQLPNGSDPGPDEFSINASGQYRFGTDPRDKLMEYSVRSNWLTINAGGVVIDNVDGYGSRDVGISINANNVTVKNSEIRDVHSTILEAGGTSNLKVLNNTMLWGGLGPTGCTRCDHPTWDGNEIAYMNSELTRTEWHAGFKVNRNDHMTVTNNHIHHSWASGVWCDSGCISGYFAHNQIDHVAQNGIHYEVSDGGADKAVIEDNLIYETGWIGDYPGMEGAVRPGIRLAGSRNVIVRNNVLAWNQRGIMVSSYPPRDPSAPQQPFPVENITVTGNTILHKDWSINASARYSLGWVDVDNPVGGAGYMFTASANNSGTGNKFWYPAPESASDRFEWNGPISTIGMFSETRGGQNSSYLTNAEKDAMVAAKSLPATPKHQ